MVLNGSEKTRKKVVQNHRVLSVKVQSVVLRLTRERRDPYEVRSLRTTILWTNPGLAKKVDSSWEGYKKVQSAKERKKIVQKKSIQTIEFYQSKWFRSTYRLHGSAATLTKSAACAEKKVGARLSPGRHLYYNRNSIEWSVIQMVLRAPKHRWRHCKPQI